MNKVVLIGRLTKDVDLKVLPDGKNMVANFTLAVKRSFSKEDNEADFIPIVVWGKQAEATATYMKKGSPIAVSGRLQVRHYENKEGQRVYVTEVISESVEFLDNKQIIKEDLSSDITPVINTEVPF